MKFFKFVCYAAGFTVLPVVAQANWVARANQATGQLDAQVVSESGLNKLAPGGPGSPVKFGTAIDYPSGGSEADSVALGDLNGDGILDVVVANFCLSESDCSEGTVSVLIGNGKGGFQAAVSYGSGGVMASSVAIADVNGDGKLDLVVANYCQSSSTCNYLFGPGSVSVLLGNGDGTFQAAVSYGSGGCNADSVAVADVNGDGHPDLVVANYSVNPTCGAYDPGEVSVLLGNGDGTFQPAVSYLSGGYSYSKVAVGDFNSDGHLDLVVTNGCINEGNCNNGVVNVLLGNRDGTFQSPVTYSSGGDYAKSVAIADLNRDGASGSGGEQFLPGVQLLPRWGERIARKRQRDIPACRQLWLRRSLWLLGSDRGRQWGRVSGSGGGGYLPEQAQLHDRIIRRGSGRARRKRRWNFSARRACQHSRKVCGIGGDWGRQW